MRQIKFRAWDYNEMIYIDDLYWFEENYYHSVNENRGDILMQFTGLKDKNGKEIYEGDIVARDDHRQPHEIVFEGGTFKEKGTNTIMSTTWEIIGNIHENPELL